MFDRTITPLGGGIMFPGVNNYDFVSLGGSLIDPFIFINILTLNPSEAGSYDFETEQVSQVGVVKYLFQDHVVSSKEITEVKFSSPLLIMQDGKSPAAFTYIDGGTELEYDEENHTKSGKQEFFVEAGVGFPVLEASQETPIPGQQSFKFRSRLVTKGNWHFFGSSILCDEVRVFVRSRMQSGLVIQAFNFL